MFNKILVYNGLFIIIFIAGIFSSEIFSSDVSRDFLEITRSAGGLAPRRQKYIILIFEESFSV